ncbi:MAG: phenylalanine--tRNA ligase subunit alpha [Actinobacteria bacterium]|nr:phenylalanine--tRNA ligase subunit alpha [Actinomycetota bacterium]
MSPSESLSHEISQAQSAALSAIAAAPDVAALRVVQADLAGKKSALSILRAQLGQIQDIDARKSAGQAINACAVEIESAIEQRMAKLQAEERAQQVVALGFQVAEGPEVETDFYNFEALNMPKTHPARSEFDTMFIEPARADQEPNSVLLRTHTSPVQIRVMQSWKPPIYAVMPGRVFRRDTPDATHMPVFHQIEGIVVDKGITFAHLAGIIEAFTKAFFGNEFTSRLRPSFFPFTEPSAEFDIRRANGAWIELGGCGMMHPNVLRAGGIDPDEFTGFAFGFGIDRMAKERHNVEDIREMYTNDLRFLRQFS